MDTYMTVTAYGEHASEAVDKAETEIKRWMKCCLPEMKTVKCTN